MYGSKCMVSDYYKMLKAQCLRDRRENDKQVARLNRIDEILKSDDIPAIKYTRLVSECGYGRMRAAELTGYKTGGKEDDCITID